MLYSIDSWSLKEFLGPRLKPVYELHRYLDLSARILTPWVLLGMFDQACDILCHVYEGESPALGTRSDSYFKNSCLSVLSPRSGLDDACRVLYGNLT